MLKKLAAASALMMLVGSSAMAQTVTDDTVYGDQYVTPADQMPMDNTAGPAIDTMPTGSIYGMSQGNSGAMTTGVGVPCASDWHSTGPDANASLNINDKYCGK